MDYGWQDRINDELRLIRRSEAWERLSTEDQALRAGHLSQRSLWAGSLPARWMHGFRVVVRNMQAAWRRPSRGWSRTGRGSRLGDHR